MIHPNLWLLAACLRPSSFSSDWTWFDWFSRYWYQLDSYRSLSMLQRSRFAHRFFRPFFFFELSFPEDPMVEALLGPASDAVFATCGSSESPGSVVDLLFFVSLGIFSFKLLYKNS